MVTSPLLCLLLLLVPLRAAAAPAQRSLLFARDTLAFVQPTAGSVFPPSDVQPLDVAFQLTRSSDDSPFVNASLLFVLHSLDLPPGAFPPTVVFFATGLDSFGNVTLDFPVTLPATGLFELTAFATDADPSTDPVGAPFADFTDNTTDVAHVWFRVAEQGDPFAEPTSVSMPPTETCTDHAPSPSPSPSASPEEEEDGGPGVGGLGGATDANGGDITVVPGTPSTSEVTATALVEEIVTLTLTLVFTVPGIVVPTATVTVAPPCPGTLTTLLPDTAAAAAAAATNASAQRRRRGWFPREF